ANLGNGLATVQGGSATVDVDNTNGLLGSFGASALTLTVPGIGIAGPVSGAVSLPHSGGGGSFTIGLGSTGAPATATVAGQALTGVFSLAADPTGIDVGVRNVTL